jgi:hypothetical protein
VSGILSEYCGPDDERIRELYPIRDEIPRSSGSGPGNRAYRGLGIGDARGNDEVVAEKFQ